VSYLADTLKSANPASSNPEYVELLRSLLVLTGESGSKESLLAGALRLYDARVLSLGSAAALAGISESEMIDALGQARVPVFQYSAKDAIRESEAV
jgi:hypothetical protein